MKSTSLSSSIQLGASLICSAALIVSMTGCSDQGNQATQLDQSSHDGHDHAHGDHDGHDHGHAEVTPDIYTDILGEISALPVENDPTTDLKIHHVHIPHFKAKDGISHVNANGIQGMGSMTMPFPLADGVSIDGYEIGDKVKFTFQVNWGSTTGKAWEVTNIEKIDPATEIDYTNRVGEIVDQAQEAIEDMNDQASDLLDDHTGHDHDGHSHDGP